MVGKSEGDELDLSIVIPLKDEGESVVRLRDEIDAVFATLPYQWECIWVDDGSTDDTLDKIRRFHQLDQHHQYVELSQNYGQSAAMYAGFCHARGRLLATLDGDGQNNPGDIPGLIELMDIENCDIVNGVRRNRQDSLVRKLSSRIANGFRNWLTRESVTDVGCSLRVFRKDCIRHISPFNGFHRFLPTLIQLYGCSRMAEMPVNHRPRKFGQTKYGIQNRLWVGILDTIAVRWMQSRVVIPGIQTTSLPPNDIIKQESRNGHE